jgi:hypothetical protein
MGTCTRTSSLFAGARHCPCLQEHEGRKEVQDAGDLQVSVQLLTRAHRTVL